MRKPGWYWVLGMGSWLPAHWDGQYWRAVGIANAMVDDVWEEIDETPIDRDKIRAVVEAADALVRQRSDPALERALAAYHGTGEDADEVSDV